MNSQYKIGDISRLFNLSSEMIRYYEKMGIIDPIRDEKNGYRYYSIFDIYILLECLQYQNLGMKIKEIPNFINFNYREKLQNAGLLTLSQSIGVIMGANIGIIASDWGDDTGISLNE